MNDVIEAERRLGLVTWLTGGPRLSRTRQYELESSLGDEAIFDALRDLISDHPVRAGALSSLRIGHETVAGYIEEPCFSARLFSPLDESVMPWARVTLDGRVQQKTPTTSRVVLTLRPGVGGLVASIAGALLGLLAIIFGISRFAVQTEWESFFIAVGIGLALVLVPCLLTLWAVVEGRENEAELLSEIGQRIGSDS